MMRTWRLSLLPISLALLTAADQPQPWKDKKVPEWTEDDTKQILGDSPWAKTVRPSIDQPTRNTRQGGMNRGPGGLGGVILGGGMPRRGGMGYPGGGYPGGGYPGGGYPGGGYPGGGYPGGGYPGGGYPGGGYPTDSTGYPGGGNGGGSGQPGANTASSEPPILHVRWESAFPIREAELKSHDANAPTLDDDAHYAVAVYGVPSRMAPGSSRTATDLLKKQAAIKRDGKKDLKPSSVEVLQRESGPVFVYLFPRKKEITLKDKRIEFDAKIGPLQFVQSFYVDDMSYDGKLAL
jgi:hypothetical protein